MRIQPPGADAPQARRNAPYLLWLVWIVWLPLLVPAVIQAVQTVPSPLRLSVMLSGLALFVALYLRATWRTSHELTRSPVLTDFAPRTDWPTIGVCMLLSVALGLLGGGREWFDPFVLTSAYVGSSLPPRQATALIGALLVLILGVAWLGGPAVSDFGTALVFVIIVGATTTSMARGVRTGRQLHAAREELMQLAVTNERLRIARDLHDLLGHNLSLIALKSELAERLVASAPAQAAGEMNAVARVARTTLQEVREAVGAYRQPSLSGERHAAAEILAAAGIAWRTEVDESMLEGLPTGVESVLAATVREGVTNVIRHSRARQAVLRLRRDGPSAAVEVTDDGAGAPPSQGVSAATAAGSAGLRGLAERVAALGGRFEAAPQTGRGFRLAVWLPLIPAERETVSLPFAPAQGEAAPRGIVPATQTTGAPSEPDEARTARQQETLK